MIRTGAAAALGLCMMLTAAGPAHAQDNRVAAEALFRDARRLLDAGKYAEACEKLASSNRIDPAVGTLINLARCYEKLGKTASAWSAWRDAAALAKQQGQAAREKTAREAADALEPVLARLTIEVPEDARDLSLRVKRDGVEVPPELWGETLPVDPGEHAVEVVAPDRKAWTTRITIEVRKVEKVTVPPLEAAPSASAAPAPAAGGALAGPDRGPATLATDEPAPRSGWNSQKTFGVVALSVGGASTIAAGVSAFVFFDKKDQLGELCVGGCESVDEQQRFHAIRDQAETAQTVGIITGIVGGVGLIGGTVLLLTAGDSSGPETGGVRFTPLAGPSEVGLAVNGAFF